MSETLGLTAGVAGRYATALFELADSQGALDAVRGDLHKVAEALEASHELRGALRDPSIRREDMVCVADALASRLGIGAYASNFVKLMASKRRLEFLPKAIVAFDALVAEKRGETTVEVTSATPLSDAQQAQIRDAASRAVGKSVAMKLAVDPELIGGVIVKMGSRMIDASVRSKLSQLRQRMKEVG